MILDTARAQAKRYELGVLGGLELSSRRYLVVVSTGTLKLPPPHQEGIVEYYPVNIAVDPAVPSKS
jgi:hypothetical protein